MFKVAEILAFESCVYLVQVAFKHVLLLSFHLMLAHLVWPWRSLGYIQYRPWLIYIFNTNLQTDLGKKRSWRKFKGGSQTVYKNKMLQTYLVWAIQCKNYEKLLSSSTHNVLCVWSFNSYLRNRNNGNSLCLSLSSLYLFPGLTLKV